MKSSHDDIADIFLFLEGVISPAEWQGYACAQIASGNAQGDAKVLAEVLEFIDSQKEPTAPQAQKLLDVYAQLRSDFAEGGFAIELLMPEDDSELLVRVEAMAAWAAGFLAGFAGVKTADLSAEIREMLSDLSAISQLTVDEEDDDDEEAEKAFFEISEYLRLVAVSVHAACVGPTEDVPTLH